MIGVLKFLLLYEAAFAFQTVLAPHVAIFGVAPDMGMLLVVYTSLRYGSAAGAMAGFLVGLSEDVYGPVEWVGASALAKSTVGFFSGFLEEKFMKLGSGAKIAVLGVSFFVADAITLSVAGMSRAQIGDIFLHRSLPEGLFTMVVGALAFAIRAPGKRRR